MSWLTHMIDWLVYFNVKCTSSALSISGGVQIYKQKNQQLSEIMSLGWEQYRQTFWLVQVGYKSTITLC